MHLRKVLSALFIVLFIGALAGAAVCPKCLKQIPDGEKYCERHKAEAMAEEASSDEELKHVDAVITSRAEYLENLEALRDFYEGRGNAQGLRKVQAELEDIKETRQFVYLHWEDKLPELSSTEESAEANTLLLDADKLRKTMNPFKRKANVRKAVETYRQILEDYPTSTASDHAAFGAAEAMASSVFGEYRRAVRLYELCYLANPKTEHDALFRAAQVCDNDLTDYETAARYYWMASKLGVSVYSRQYASSRLKQLQKRDFGTMYQ